jgi:hypothetical protein
MLQEQTLQEQRDELEALKREHLEKAEAWRMRQDSMDFLLQD